MTVSMKYLQKYEKNAKLDDMKKGDKYKPELIAPAGNMEKMKTAFAFGADAAYLGVPEYSLRSRINEFTPARIKKACEYAHERGKKIYATINIIAHEEHFKNLAKHIIELKNAQVDGIIISDPGVLSVVKKIWPKAKLHLSTQANCINSEAAKFWFEQGVSRVVLGRETRLQDIIKIHKTVPKLELEYFVHGAMCVSYSGRCFLSKHLNNRSANLGDCIQPCRWQYGIKNLELRNKNIIGSMNADIAVELGGDKLKVEEDERGSYIFNSKDLCLIKHLEKLAKAGVASFKIEGRTKSAYYVATVVGAYRRAIEHVDESPRKKNYLLNYLKAELSEKIYNRGYTNGFLFGDGGKEQELEYSHKKSEWEFCGEALKSKKLKVKNKKSLIHIKVHNTIKIGDYVEVVMPGYDIMKIRINGMVDSNTGENIKEAHGGKGRIVIIESDIDIPEYSVLRRKI
jgi:U32 family peptidase